MENRGQEGGEAYRRAGADHPAAPSAGGGFYENVPRCIPDGLCARIDKAAVKTPAIFRLLQKKGGIDEHDMFNTFNMGVGMAVIVSPETADAALSALKAEGIDAYVCGEIVAGEEKVVLC